MRKRISKIFFAPSDWFVKKTSARSRQAINFWLLLLWLFPGFAIWFVLKSALWFVGFMSIYAIWTTHWGGFSAETPTEDEE